MKNRKQMREFDEKLTDEAEVLNCYLFQYKECIGKKKSLERRMVEIRKEFDCPIPAIKMDGMPRGNSVGDGSVASLVYRLDEIETKINEQIDKSTKILANIMNVIDFLPENSLERAIIENRYIDRMGWDRVCRENHASKSKINRYWKKGLYTLLEFKKVKQILKEYESTLKKY